MWMSVALIRVSAENVVIFSTATPVYVRWDSQGKIVKDVSGKEIGKSK